MPGTTFFPAPGQSVLTCHYRTVLDDCSDKIPMAAPRAGVSYVSLMMTAYTAQEEFTEKCLRAAHVVPGPRPLTWDDGTC